MAISVKCPCGKTFALPDGTPASKRFRCKECERVLTVPTTEPRDGGSTESREREKSRPTSSNSPPVQPVKAAKPAPRRRNDDDDFLSGFDAAVRQSKQSEAIDQDELAPRKRRSRSDDDIDEDEEWQSPLAGDDAPAPRKRRRKSSSGGGGNLLDSLFGGPAWEQPFDGWEYAGNVHWYNMLATAVIGVFAMTYFLPKDADIVQGNPNGPGYAMLGLVVYFSIIMLIATGVARNLFARSAILRFGFLAMQLLMGVSQLIVATSSEMVIRSDPLPQHARFLIGVCGVSQLFGWWGFRTLTRIGDFASRREAIVPAVCYLQCTIVFTVLQSSGVVRFPKANGSPAQPPAHPQVAPPAAAPVPHALPFPPSGAPQPSRPNPNPSMPASTPSPPPAFPDPEPVRRDAMANVKDPTLPLSNQIARFAPTDIGRPVLIVKDGRVVKGRLAEPLSEEQATFVPERRAGREGWSVKPSDVMTLTEDEFSYVEVD